MAKEDINKIFEESKDALNKKREAFVTTIQEDLEKFKKDTLTKV